MHQLAMKLGQNALVLKEFTINRDGPEYVHIVARKAGLIAWLMTLLKIDPTTDFRVFADRIEFDEGSLSGKLHTTIPLSSVSISSCGHTKPILYLLLAVICMFTCFLLPISILLVIFYFLHKALVISVVSNSGWPAAICFKRSVIEGVNVAYEQAEEVIGIINSLIMAQTSK